MGGRARTLAVACALLAAGLPVAFAAPAAPAGGHVAYRATRRTNALAPVRLNRPLAGYRGPRLALRTTYVGARTLEPTLGVTRDGTVFYGAAPWTESRMRVHQRMRVLTTRDGGRTWPVAREPGPPGSVLVDPYLHVDRATDRIFAVDLQGSCAAVAHSDDRGRTWRDVPVCGLTLVDKPSVVTGPPPPGQPRAVGYPNYVYLCFNQVVNAVCHRSLDGGLTFAPSGMPVLDGVDLLDETQRFCSVPHGHVAADSAGWLFVPAAHCGEPWLASSSDGGQTWRRSRVSDIASFGAVTSVAADTAGNLYYVWWDDRDRLAYLSVSRDHGATWERPLNITPPGVTEVNAPAVAAGVPGRVAVSFAGSSARDWADPLRPWSFYVVTSTDALSAAPTFVAATANPPRDPIHRGDCPDARCGAMMDFLDVDIAPDGAVWATAVDTCTVELHCTSATPQAGSAVAAQGIAVVQVAGPGLPGKR